MEWTSGFLEITKLSLAGALDVRYSCMSFHVFSSPGPKAHKVS